MLKDKLKRDSTEALKNHDQKMVDTLRFLISLIDKKELSLPVGEMTEAEEVRVLRKELKNKEESREMFVKGGRNDLVAQLDYEIEIVKSYLPAEITEDQIKKVVDEIIGGKENNFGLVMKEVMTKLGGEVEGSTVARIVKEKLSGN
ncbi:MAG TPA: GatB/YqeY domain-containing protein [Candidatus Woesebacteria bacterium]|nr:GatB/YqeY domain-containing protein [Candidatus Woesebacteria bacterium]